MRAQLLDRYDGWSVGREGGGEAGGEEERHLVTRYRSHMQYYHSNKL